MYLVSIKLFLKATLLIDVFANMRGGLLATADLCLLVWTASIPEYFIKVRPVASRLLLYLEFCTRVFVQIHLLWCKQPPSKLQVMWCQFVVVFHCCHLFTNL